MWVKVLIVENSKPRDKTEMIPDLSKLTTIKVLRQRIFEMCDIPVEKQTLYHGGKQLIDEHTLFDYKIGYDQTIHVIVSNDKSNLSPIKNKENISGIQNDAKVEAKMIKKEINHSKYFKIDEVVDAKDDDYGAWFEAKILKIFIDVESEEISDSDMDEENVQYVVIFLSYEEEGEKTLPLSHIRRRSKKILDFEEISVGDTIMVNYNMEQPKERGYWYDCLVTEKSTGKKRRALSGTIYIGMDKIEYKNCNIKFFDEIFAIEENIPLSEKDEDLDTSVIRKTHKVRCEHCKDNPKRKCKECSCCVCGKKDSEAMQILCDECDDAYHIWCLKPPLSAVPNDDFWYCPKCKNDVDEVVKPGEKLKESKKRKKMPSAKPKSDRDWGKGMATAARTTTCTIVPSTHFGPIPGIEVGSMWKYRVQCAEAGVHRPQVAGIAGSSKTGAYSIVLSGGYEDDKDDGEEFLYTGSGGRDLEGNKRTAAQSCDQVLEAFNLALARNCDCPINKQTGGEATDWKEGKPVRVVRNFKGRKHSKYAPEEGNRYDGIYKVVKYWPEKGKSGFLVWRYLLRRDDPIPPPWTKEGKKRIEALGLTMKYPAGYIESQKAKAKLNQKTKNGKRNPKNDEDDETKPTVSKKRKIDYKLPQDIKDEIDKDERNIKLWKECLNHVSDGHMAFLDQVKIQFECICCQDLLSNPVTTKCTHNVCQECLKRSFDAKVYSCPICRENLDKKCISDVNQNLKNILLKLFPNYRPQ